MNLQQLQYIVAVDEHRHFQRAADACFVTPATLSMMIKKLEQELDVSLFDRSKQPIITTEVGEQIVDKAKTVLFHVKELENLAKNKATEIAGDISIAIIPTLAPYLTHLFLPSMMSKYPYLKIKLYEWNTHQIIEGLKHNRIDIGIAATPLHRKEIKEYPLFNERLVAYTTEETSPNQKPYIIPAEINLSKLWLLHEDHCLRSQVANLCSLRQGQDNNFQLDFEAGSIETLLNIVHINQGITVIPELAVHSLDEERKKNVKEFAELIPVRQISLLTYRHFMKEKIRKVLGDEITAAIQKIIPISNSKQEVISI